MSREIKFKYWFKNKLTGEITWQIFTLEQIEKGEASFIHLKSQQLEMIARCQYVGLKDKNGTGKEIYDGDEIKFQWLNEFYEGVVYYNKKNARFFTTNYDNRIPSHGEVIGSIHDKGGEA